MKCNGTSATEKTTKKLKTPLITCARGSDGSCRQLCTTERNVFFFFIATFFLTALDAAVKNIEFSIY